MKIAVLSGKGGTGKTYITLLLASLFKENFTLYEADLDAPNLALYLNKKLLSEEKILKFIPKFTDKCNSCGQCARECNFGALIVPKNRKPILNQFLCHSCKMCFYVCPNDAIEEEQRISGYFTEYLVDEVFSNESLKVNFNLKEFKIEKAEHILEFVLHKLEENLDKEEGKVLIDLPAGINEVVKSVVEKSDLLIFVVEDTFFGFKNFVDLLNSIDEEKQVILIFNKVSGKNIYREKLEEKFNLIKFEFDKKVVENLRNGKIYSKANFIEKLKETLEEKNYINLSDLKKVVNEVDKEVTLDEEKILKVVPDLDFTVDEGEKIVVTAGKGGAGKTLISLALLKKNRNVEVFDADIVTKSIALLKGDWKVIEEIKTDFNVILDEEKCLKCNLCTEVCEFGAINNGILEGNCEGCGVCVYKCPNNAIKLEVKTGAVILKSDNFYTANLFKISSLGKVVDRLLLNSRSSSIIDTLAGTSCPVISALKFAKKIVLVIEATKSGFLDASRIVEILDVMNFDFSKLYFVFNKVVEGKETLFIEFKQLFSKDLSEKLLEKNILAFVKLDKTLNSYSNI